MNRHFNAICKKLDIKADTVLSYKEYDDRISLVVDLGIKGGKKFSIPLSELPEPKEEKPKEEKPAKEEKPKRRTRSKK